MQLKKLEFHNFRSFGDATLDLEEVTLLTGPNNVGKSMLLDAVNVLLSPPADYGAAWIELAQRRRPNMPGQNDLTDEQWVDPTGPVWIIGTFGELSPDEAQLWDLYSNSGSLKISVFFEDPDAVPHKNTEETRYVVLPAAHEAVGLTGPGPEYPEPVVLEDRGEVWVPWGLVVDVLLNSPALLLAVSDLSLRLPQVVAFPGPDSPAQTSGELLTPFVESSVDELLKSLPEDFETSLVDRADAVTWKLSEKLNDVAPVYLSDSARLSVHHAGYSQLRSAVLAAIGDLQIHVSLGNGIAPEPWDPEENWLPPGAEPYPFVSAGTRRAVAMATLELYADPEVWPATKSVILLIEEPEAGLHAAAQRRVARALSRFRGRSGIQALIVSHSPILIDAVPVSAIRIVRRKVDDDVDLSEVRPAFDLGAVAEALGAKPADVLLGRCFVVVEGATEVAVLPIWARKLGLDLDRLGVKLFAAEGWSNETTLARLTELVYPSARLHALLDGGTGPEMERDKLLRRFGDRVDVQVLSVTEIEGAFTESAVARWIEDNQGNPARSRGFGMAASAGRAKKMLQEIANAQWNRTYKVVQDGAAIAECMSAGEIHPDVGQWLLNLDE